MVCYAQDIASAILTCFTMKKSSDCTRLAALICLLECFDFTKILLTNDVTRTIILFIGTGLIRLELLNCLGYISFVNEHHLPFCKIHVFRNLRRGLSNISENSNVSVRMPERIFG